MKSNTYYLLLLIACTLFTTNCKNKAKADKNNPNTTSTQLTSNEKHTAKESDSNKGDGYKRYEEKSGIIEFEISGTMNSGKESLFFDNYGRREAKHTQTTVTVPGLNMKQTSNQISIMDGDWMYNIDLDKKTGHKMKAPLLEELTEGQGTDDLGKVGKEMLKQMGGKKVGEEKIMGKNCEIWEVEGMGTKVWIWNGLSLKTETNMMGMIVNQIVTKIETNISIPNEKFEVPQGITMTEGNPMDQLKGMKGLDQLKDLDLSKLKDIDLSKLKEMGDKLKELETQKK